MAATSKEKRLLELLLEKSRQGSITWEKTQKDATFQTSFPSFSVQTTEHMNTDEYGDPYIYHTLRIYNDEGELIEELSGSDFNFAQFNASELLEELYALARRLAHGVEQAIDEILNLLEEDDPF